MTFALPSRRGLASHRVLTGAAVLTLLDVLVATIGHHPAVAVGLAFLPLLLGLVCRVRAAALPWLVLVPIVLAGLSVPKLGVPLADAGAALALVMALARPVALPPGLPGWLKALLVAVLVAGLLTVPVDHPPLGGAVKRLIHIAILVLLVAAIAHGRLSTGNVVRAIEVGLALGLVSGLGSFVGVLDNYGYPHRLTGWFEDPNVAAYEAVVLGLVALHHVRSRRERRLVVATMVLITVLSLSRTGLFALAVSLFWVAGGYRVPKVLGAAFVAAATFIALRLPASLLTFGPFADHAQSDNLRQLINAAGSAKAAAHFLTGAGAGTAYLHISNGEKFFFHNSYYAMVAEFGLLLTAVYLGLLVYTAAKLARSRPRSPALEAGMVAMLVVALSLGEVLLALTAGLLLGTVWSHVLTAARGSDGATLADPPRQSAPEALVGTGQGPLGAKAPLPRLVGRW